MANNLDLQESVLNLVSQILRRVKPLKTLLPCSALIDQIIRPEMFPLACNLGIAFVDVGLPLERTSRRTDCAKAIVKAMDLYLSDPYSAQMQALFGYSILVLDDLPAVMESSHASSALQLLISDFLIDVSLLKHNLSEGTVGSVLPGLSEARVKRLMLKRDVWKTDEDLTALKHRLLSCIGEMTSQRSAIEAASYETRVMKKKHYFPTELAHAVTISIILQHDSDSELSRQATFKLNGCRTILRTRAETDAEDTNTSPEADSAVNITMRQLFSLALGPERNASASVSGLSSGPRTAKAILYELNSQFGRRLSLHPDIRAALLRWIARDASEYLSDVAPECLECVYSNIMLRSSLVGTARIAADVSDILKLACVTILQKTVSSLSDDSLIEVCDDRSDSESIDSPCGLKSEEDLVFVCISLLPQLGQLSLHTDDCQIDIRKTVYSLIARICQVFPRVVTKDASMLRTLFALMELEDERIMTHLLTAIAALKTAFERAGLLS